MLAKVVLTLYLAHDTPFSVSGVDSVLGSVGIGMRAEAISDVVFVQRQYCFGKSPATSYLEHLVRKVASARVCAASEDSCLVLEFIVGMVGTGVPEGFHE